MDSLPKDGSAAAVDSNFFTQSVNTQPSALDKVCVNCNQPYVAKVTWQKFCSEPCRLEYHGLTKGEASKIGLRKRI